ncbi:hypothetical protein HA050_10395 [Iodobacter sp. HSC-16F04]|uniref:Coenzyme Q-binding protein COQ10 START domain-containing protein n=1 Tax=Iodobacter violaceini TaxID=3044271 RepID=A0ABX0L1W7_9NEIS|nr:SRPBCC family protein [Iodobacter violacea]NHQ86523.1 hypothetical protein [Iodobacter violacea]
MPDKLLLSVLFALAVPAVAAQGIDVNALTEQQVTMVDQSKADQAGKTFLAATLMNAPVQKVCAVIQNYADYPSFMPNVAKVKVATTGDDSPVLDMTLHLPLGKVKKYRLKMTPRQGAQQCQLSWKMLQWEGLKADETIADTSGYWLITPSAANPAKTVVKYFVFTDPGPVPMGLGWIVDSLSKDSIPKMLDALRNKLK